MLVSHPWLSIIPPLAAVFIAIRFKQIFVALFLGLWVGATFLANGNILKGLFGAMERCIDVFKDTDLAKVVLFCCFIGAVMAFAQRSGGIKGFIEFLSRRDIVKNRRQAEFLTVAISTLIPIESSINVLVPGSISRPLYDRLKISREKLAFLCLSFCAPICSLIPINAWGAYVSGVMAGQGISQPFKVYIKAIPMNLYSFFAIGFAIILIIVQKDFFTMAKAEKRAQEGGKALKDSPSSLVSSDSLSVDPKEGIVPRPSNMFVPIVTMIIAMIAGMFVTGHGHFTEGSGATSVFYAVIAAIVVAGLKYKLSGIMSFNESADLFFKAVGGLAGMGFLITLSFALSTLCLDMKTGLFVAGVAQHVINLKFVPAILFILTAFVSFATGTAWGSWAIMFPIGLGFVPGINTASLIIIGAMMSGGVFGNHCSPIADTTIMSTVAAGCDHVDNVDCLLPYALTIAVFTALVYLVIGLIIF